MYKLFAVLILISTSSFAGGFLGDYGPGGRNLDLADAAYIKLTEGRFRPNNQIQTGLKINTRMLGFSDVDYELISVYGVAVAVRDSTARHQTATGISGVSFKDSATANTAGVECDAFNFFLGGSSSCMRIKFTQTLPGDVGISFEPPSYAENLVGISFEKNPQAYKYAANFAGSPVAMGSKAGSTYCIQFNETSAELEYIKNCGTSAEQVIGTITITPRLLKGSR
jgi:hypothetical protein